MDEEIGNRIIFFSPWGILFIFLLIIIGNLFILDIFLFSGKQQNKPVKPTPQPNYDSCGQTCKKEIQNAIALLLPTTTPLKSTPIKATIKESFITLGSGSGTNSTWTDIPSTQSYVDSTAYGKIKSITFEVSLYTPTGNQTAYARLYNVTDSHPVWNSDVTIEGGTAQLKISSPITLDPGTKLYQVQMKTQLQSRTNLENARIHILSYQ